MVSQDQMWKGTLIQLIIRKNQAAVPINSRLGRRVASKYTDMTGPAALPTIVVKPPAKPVKLLTSG